MHNYNRNILPNPKVHVDLIVKPLKLPTHSICAFHTLDILPENIVWKDKALGKSWHAFIQKYHAKKNNTEGFVYVVRITSTNLKQLPPNSGN